MRILLFCICTIFFLQACSQQAISEEVPEIVNVVGEIFPDHNLDESDFTICHDQRQIVQYYAFSEKTYEGEKAAIDEHFQSQYKKVDSPDSGLIRIRFIVNCKGESGRFRLMGMDNDYQPKQFSEAITSQLMSLTKSLKGWKAMKGQAQTRDYYQYLIFKIEKGQIIEIMP